MRVLILSCNTGEGHNSCAAALKEYFTAHGRDCDVADALSFLSDGLSQFISHWHTRIYRYLPFLFRGGYRFAEEHPAVFREQSKIYRLLTSGAGRLYQFLLDGGYDTVVCTHVFAAFVIEVLLKEHPGAWRTSFVATDYTCSPHGSGHALDWYFIPDKALAGEFTQSGIPAEKLVGTGIPVRMGFQGPGDREKAKADLGIPADYRHLLVMCGSMGCGPIRKVVERLSAALPAESAVTVICGTNNRLRQKLEGQFAGDPRIKIWGYVNQMPLMMDSADLYLTKPGGISVTEAAAKCLPMAFVDAVAGCEAYNMRYFIERGGAVTADTPEDLADACVRLLSDRQQLESMSDSLRALHMGQASGKIYQILTEETVCGLM